MGKSSKDRSSKSGASNRSLGFEDEDLGSSPCWWAATLATYCPSKVVEHPSKSTKPSLRGHGTPCTTKENSPNLNSRIPSTSEHEVRPRPREVAPFQNKGMRLAGFPIGFPAFYATVIIGYKLCQSDIVTHRLL